MQPNNILQVAKKNEDQAAFRETIKKTGQSEGAYWEYSKGSRLAKMWTARWSRDDRPGAEGQEELCRRGQYKSC